MSVHRDQQQQSVQEYHLHTPPRSRSNRDRSGRCTDNSNIAVLSTCTGSHHRQLRLSFCSVSWSIRAISTALSTKMPVTMRVSTRCFVRTTRHHRVVHRGRVLECIDLQPLSLRQPSCSSFFLHLELSVLDMSAPSAQAISLASFRSQNIHLVYVRLFFCSPIWCICVLTRHDSRAPSNRYVNLG